MKTIATLLVALATLASAACIEEAHASPAAPLALANEVAASDSVGYNTGKNRVFNQLRINDGSGVVTTVAAAGTPVVVDDATLITAQSEDGSACITDTATGGLLTIAGCGAGKVEITLCITDAIGVNSATWTAGIYRTRAEVVTAQSNLIRSIEGGTAARNGEGCVETIVTAASGDTYDVRVDSGTNADTVTIRSMTFTALRLSSL